MSLDEQATVALEGYINGAERNRSPSWVVMKRKRYRSGFWSEPLGPCFGGCCSSFGNPEDSPIDLPSRMESMDLAHMDEDYVEE